MQEIYDQRVLHSILGVKPLPTVVKHAQTDEKIYRPISSKQQASQVVEDAWEETKQSRDYEESCHPRQHYRVGDDREEGGRYDIGRPSKKRRRSGRTKDDNAVIFVDDDDDDGAGTEEGEYDSHEDDIDEYRPYSEKPRNDKRRSYWLSKGIGPSDADISC